MGMQKGLIAILYVPAYLSKVTADRSVILRRISQLQPGTCPYVPHVA